MGGIIDRTIGSRQELEARLKAQDGYANIGRLQEIPETRKVNPDQATILQNVLRINATGRACLQSLAATNSYLRDIANRAISTRKELQGRLEVQNGYADIGRESIRETRTVEKDQRPFILQQFESLREVRDLATSARDFASFLTSIMNKTIPSRKELQARLEAKDGYVDMYPNFARESRKVSKEQAAILLSTFDAFSKLDQATQRSIQEAWSRGADLKEPARIMEARRQKAVTNEDKNLLDAAATTVATVLLVARRSKLEQRVFATIQKEPRDIRTSFEVLRDYEVETDSDRAFTQTLIKAAYQARRFYVAKDLLEGVGALTTTEAYTETLQRIAEFADSPDPADSRMAATLTRLLYQAELAKISVDLLRQARPSPNFNVEAYQQLVGSLPLRASIADFDYVAQQQTLLAKLQPIVAMAQSCRTALELDSIARRFRDSSARDILETIARLPSETSQDAALQQNILKFYKQYLLSRREQRRQDCEVAFAFEIAALRQVLAPEYEFDQGLGRNLQAVKLLAGRFGQAVLPLYEALRGEPQGENLEAFTSRRDPASRRQRYIQNLGRLAAQRPLSPIERPYLESVELLSMFNPHLVGLANLNRGVTSVYLESYFNTLSQRTLDDIQDGDHIPIIQLGLGPNGLAAAGELVRSWPEAAAETLFIDASSLVGGPFAIPEGAAWELNSANSNETEGPVLPPAPDPNLENKTVRAYGSPLRWYPGERSEGRDVRQGSINSTVDYLLTPDNISDSRYPDNADEALVLQLQAALLIRRMALRTRIVSARNIGDDTHPYRKLLTLERTEEDGTIRRVRVTTDALLPISGLGQPSYGFDISRSKAKDVVASTQQQPCFPKISDTLTAFRALEASREDESLAPGETIVIYGNGNSADTLIEYIGSLFPSGNKGVRRVKKIYLITTGQTSRRPRYAAITDLRPRNGRGNLVEEIKARVGDVAPASQNAEGSDQQLAIFDTAGNMIRNQNGEIIRADNVIAATGFRPQLDDLLSELTQGQSLRDPSTLSKVTLPTNPNVTIADRLAADPTVLIAGTASRTGFEVADKLKQLPLPAREALLRNGAENAVAIGFRAPDTQAAVRLHVEKLREMGIIQPSRIASLPSRRIAVEGSMTTQESLTIPRPPASLPPTRSTVAADSSILTPLLLGQLVDLRLTGKALPPQARYEVKLNKAGELRLSSPDGSSATLGAAVATACADPYFQSYARQALRTRRSSTAIEIRLTFRHNRLNLRGSYAQAI